MMLLGEASAGDIQRHLKSLIFVGVFFLTMIAAAIWWLKR